MKKNIVAFEKKISPMVEKARELEIKNALDMKKAVELLSKLNQFNDKIVAEKERVTKPLNEALKAERSRWKPIEVVNGEAIDIVREKMSEYQTEEVRKQKEEELKIASRVGEGKGKLKIETAVKKISEIDVVKSNIPTNIGDVQFAEVKKFEVIDITLLPIRYHIANEIEIRRAMKEGIELPGVKYWVEQQPRNYR